MANLIRTNVVFALVTVLTVAGVSLAAGADDPVATSADEPTVDEEAHLLAETDMELPKREALWKGERPDPGGAFAMGAAVAHNISDVPAPAPTSFEAGGSTFADDAVIERFRAQRESVFQGLLHSAKALQNRPSMDMQARSTETDFASLSPTTGADPAISTPLALPLKATAPGIEEARRAVDEMSVPASQDSPSDYEDHPPILIDSNDDFESCTCVRQGSGTAEDPYVISGWYIEAEAPSSVDFQETRTSAVKIENTDAHFVVRDNWITEADSSEKSSAHAFHLENVTHGILASNVVERIGYPGQIGEISYGRIGSLFEKGGVEDFRIERNLFKDTLKQGDSTLDVVGRNVTLTENIFRDARGMKVTVEDGRVIDNVLDDSVELTVHASRNVHILNNTIVNGEQAGITEDGTGMHLWTSSSRIADNTVDGFFHARQVSESTIEDNVVDSNLYAEIGRYGSPNVAVVNNSFYTAGIVLDLHDFSFENNTVLTRAEGIFHWCCGAGGLSIRSPENGTVRNNDIEVLGAWEKGTKVHDVGTLDTDRAVGLQLHGRYTDTETVYANNSIEGYKTCVRTGTIWMLHPIRFDAGVAHQRWENNTLTGCDLAWHIDASPHQTLRNNSAEGIEKGVKYVPMRFDDVYQDIDTSNTINGEPMLWLVGENNASLEDPDQPYSFIGVTDSANVTIANKTLSGLADRIFAFNATGLAIENVTMEDNQRNLTPSQRYRPAKAVRVTYASDATLANSTFAHNRQSVEGLAANLHVHDNTFHGDEIESVRLSWWSPTVENNTFTAIDPPAWFPEERHAGTVIQYTENATVRNNSFENDIFGVLTFFDRNTTIVDNRIQGGVYAISAFVSEGVQIRDNTVQRSLYGVDVTYGWGQPVMMNNTVRQTRGFGLTAIDAQDVRIDNNLVTSRMIGIGMHEDTRISLEAYGDITRNLVLVDGLEHRQLAGIFTNDRAGDNTTRIVSNTIHPGPRGAGIVDDNDDYEDGCETPNEYWVEDNAIRWGLAGIVVQCDNMAKSDPAPHQIHGNRIEGNDVGLIAFPFEGNISATYNWWGAADGPNYTEAGINGSGDRIDNQGYDVDIEVAPWLEQPPEREVDIPLEAEITNSDPATDTVSIEVNTTDGAEVLLLPGTRELPRSLGTDPAGFSHEYVAPGSYRPVVAARTTEGAALENTQIHMSSHRPELDPRPGTAVIGEPTAIDLGYGTDDGFVIRSQVAFGDGEEAMWQTSSFNVSDAKDANPGSMQVSAPSVGSGRTVTVLTEGPPEAVADLVEANYGPVEKTFGLADALRAEVPADRVPTLENESWVRGITVTPMGEPSLNTVRPSLETDRAWNRGLVGEGVTIATLDTGVNDGHPDLQGQIRAAFDFSDQNCNEEGEREAGADEPCPGTEDATGHGTATAGIMAGTGADSASRYTGVAPGADLVDLRVSNDNGKVPLDWMVDALEWIDDHREEYSIDVVYNTVTWPCYIATKGGWVYVCDMPVWNEPLVPMVNELTDRGLPVVTPAGAEGWRGEDSLRLPSHAYGPITVGAVSDLGTPSAGDDVRPYWSGEGGPKQGLKPDVVAPGVAITAPSALGSGYIQGDGTSASTAAVAGLVAQILDRDPELSPQEIKDTLNATAVRPASMEESAPSTRHGHGVANARAVENVSGEVPFVFEHTYGEPGVYDVSATAMDSLADEAEASTDVTVHGVIPGFGVLTEVPRALVNVSFADDSLSLPDANLSYTWGFGDGTVVTDAGSSVNHTYDEPGNYTVTLTVTEAGYGSWSTSQVVDVAPSRPGVHVLEPVDQATGTVSDTIVVGETTELRVTANPNEGTVDEVTIYPDGPDGPSVDARRWSEDLWVASYEYTSAGEVEILAEALDDEGFVGNDSRTVEVVKNSPPEVAAIRDRIVDGLPQVGLDASESVDPEGRPVAFNWTVSNGTSTVWLAERSEPSWVPSSVGVWNVTLTVTDSLGAEATSTAQVVVDDAIRAPPSLLSVDGDADSVGVGERPVMALAVVDQAGRAVADADARISITPEAGGGPFRRQVSTSPGATGVVLERLPYDVGEGELGFNLVGDHRVVVEVKASSVPGAPVEDVERFVGGLSYTVDAGG